MKRIMYLVAVWLLGGWAVTGRADRVDDYIRAEMQKRHLPGLSLAVIRDGKIIKARGYGLASLELNVPATPDTVYQLASVTKQFTAAGVLLLVEDGKVGLDDRISQYLPGLPNAWNAITIRHLLTHTSGIPNYLSASGVVWEQEYTPDKIVQLVAASPPAFPPGEQWSYSNTGYVLLAMLIAKVSGKPYDIFLTERIFRPLGMTATRRSDLSALIPKRASGYQWENNALQNAEHLNPTLWDNGDGGLISTVLDLAKWEAELSSGGCVFQPASLRLMWTPARLKNGYNARTLFDGEYGFGWFLDSYRGHRFVWHSGGRPGTAACISRFVQDKLTVIILSNRDSWNPIGLTKSVAGFYNAALLPPNRMKAQPDTEPQLTGSLKHALSDWANGKTDSPLLMPGLRAFLPVKGDAELAQQWKSLREFTFIAEETVAGHTIDLYGARVQRLRYYKLTNDKETWYYTFFLTEDGKIASFQSARE